MVRLLSHRKKALNSSRQTADPVQGVNKSNINSFPLLTTYSAFEILLKTYSFDDVNSGKVNILDLLKGSIKPRNDPAVEGLF